MLPKTLDTRREGDSSENMGRRSYEPARYANDRLQNMRKRKAGEDMSGIEFDYYPSFAAWPWAFGINRNAFPRLQIRWWLRIGPFEVRMWA